MVNWPLSLVRLMRSRGTVVKAESAKLLCKPTTTPCMGSRSLARNTMPDTCSVSMLSPVEKAKL